MTIPGRDLGMLRQPGHRFFFDAAEVEPLLPEEARTKIQRQACEHPDCRHRKYFLRATTHSASKW